jgi:hypothetical protein
VSLHVVNGNYRFRLYLNRGGTNSIPVNFDPIHFHSFLEALKDIVNNDTSDKFSIAHKTNFVNGQRVDTPVTDVVISGGRGTDGVVYISFEVKRSPIAVFPFLPSFYYQYTGSDGQPLIKEKASTYAARGWINLIEKLSDTYLAVKTTEPQPFNSNAGAGNQNAPKPTYAPRPDYTPVPNNQPVDSNSDWEIVPTGTATPNFDDDIPF